MIPPMAGRDDHAAAIRALIARQPGRPDDTAGLLRRVCRAATQALAVSGAGISLMTDDGARTVCAASDPLCERIEDLQFVLGEGPCIDAHATRRPVLIPDLEDGAAHRWPFYTPAAREGGVRAVFAFPLQVGAARLGVLDVFRERAGMLTVDELPLALTFADVAVESLLDGPEHVASAVEHQAELFQAQGMVMVQLGVGIGEATARMRAYAYAEDRPLIDIARDVVARTLRFNQLPEDGQSND